MFEEVIEDIKDSFQDAKKGNGLSILIIGFVVVFILVLLKDKNTDTSEVVYAYNSYPTADQNANVIIDSLYDSLQYTEAELKETIEENFVATNDYINEGLQKQEDLANKIYDETMTNFDDLNTKVSNVDKKVDNVSNTVTTIKNTVNNVKDTVTKTNNSVNNIAKNTAKTSGTNSKTTASKTVTLKANYKGNSIVDGLKSIGVNSSYDYRKKLATANGIKNYTGSAKQNTTLLNKLKKGTLIKA